MSKLDWISVRPADLPEGRAKTASAYGKLTGKPAACLTIAGPGATNLLTGMWDAKVDRAPVLALTGQVQTQVMGPGAFQDIDLRSAFQAVSRFSQPVLSTSNHTELASLACKTALVNPSFAAFARLCRAHGTKATKGAEVAAALAEALAIDGPALVEIMTDAELG